MSKTKSKTHSLFIKEMKNIDDNIEILGEYVNNHTNIKCRCIKHDYIFETIPQRLLNGSTGCVKCYKYKNVKNRIKTQKAFLEEIAIKNKNVIVLGQYTGAFKPVLVKCKHCGREWEATPSSLYQGFGCGHCCISKGENKVIDILHKHNINFYRQIKYKNLRGVGNLPLSYDFYLPDYNLLIEYQGRQHREPVDVFGSEKAFDIQLQHDKIKKEYAQTHSINLLEIWYDDKNIEQTILDYIQ